MIERKVLYTKSDKLRGLYMVRGDWGETSVEAAREDTREGNYLYVNEERRTYNKIQGAANDVPLYEKERIVLKVMWDRNGTLDIIGGDWGSTSVRAANQDMKKEVYRYFTGHIINKNEIEIDVEISPYGEDFISTHPNSTEVDNLENMPQLLEKDIV